MEITPFEFGLVGGALIVLWKMVDLLKQTYLIRRANGNGSLNHFQHIKEIHKYMESTQRAIDQGKFFCAWQGRDEVRDLLEQMKQSSRCAKELTAAINLLHTDLKKLRPL